MRFIAKSEIIKVTDKVEKEYLECWKIFKDFRSSNFNIDKLFSFQPKLANAIYKEEEIYYKICEEEQYLIKNKNKYKIEWFKKRMKRLKEYKEFINKVISIGKCIGDGFIYVFYNKDMDLIKKHSKNPRVTHMAKGLGTKAELTFINNTAVLNGCIVLYHGICNFLNIGDISLYSPQNSRIVAIGELKSRQEENNILGISVDFISKINFTGDAILYAPNGKQSELKFNSEIKHHEGFPNFVIERLERQIKNMKNMFSKDKQEIKKIGDKKAMYYYKELEKICKKSKSKGACVEKVCNSLVIACFINDNKKLSEHLSSNIKNKKNVETNFDLEEVNKIIIKESKYNSIHLSELPLICHYGNVPLAMWNLNINLLKDIIFQRISIFTIFNPAYIIKKLENNGYTYKKQLDNSISFSKKIDDKRIMELHNAEFHFHLISMFLMSEDEVLNLLQASEDAFLSSNLNGNVKADFEIIQRA